MVADPAMRHDMKNHNWCVDLTAQKQYITSTQKHNRMQSHQNINTCLITTYSTKWNIWLVCKLASIFALIFLTVNKQL